MDSTGEWSSVVSREEAEVLLDELEELGFPVAEAWMLERNAPESWIAGTRPDSLWLARWWVRLANDSVSVDAGNASAWLLDLNEFEKRGSRLARALADRIRSYLGLTETVGQHLAERTIA